jgi:hypothetical protein
LDEEKSKYGGLAQEYSFGSAQLHRLRWLVKDAAMLSTCRKERSE